PSPCLAARAAPCRSSVVFAALWCRLFGVRWFSVLPTTVGEARLRVLGLSLVTVFRGYDRFRGRRAQHRDLPLEVAQRVERAVDAREPQVGDLVQLAQRAQDGQPHLVAGHLGRPAGPDRLLHPLRQQRDGVLVDRPALACLADARHDLDPAERLGHTAALHDREDGLLNGGEPAAALRAGTTTADQGTVV